MVVLVVFVLGVFYRLLMANLLPIARRPGSEDEGELVARVLAILSVILGPERDDYFDDVSSTLMRLIKHDRRESVRVEALNAYALIAFICCSDNDEAALSTRLNAVETFLNTTYPNSVVTAAMNAWGLLATTHVTETLAHSVLPLWLEVFVDFLEHANVDVRMAAGENIALLFEAAENTSTEVPEREAIAFVLLTLSKESSKRNAKKERKEQRVVFRDVCATVVERESPLLSLTINEEPMSFDGWHALKQLSAIRTCLKTGFQEHIQYNALLRALLELPDLDGVEQRQMIDSGSFRVKVSKSSSLSKDRSADRRNSRKQRESEKHAFLFDD